MSKKGRYLWHPTPRPAANAHPELLWRIRYAQVPNVGRKRLPQLVFTWVFQSSSCSQIARTRKILRKIVVFARKICCYDMAWFSTHFMKMRPICNFSAENRNETVNSDLQLAQGCNANSDIVKIRPNHHIGFARKKDDFLRKTMR